MCYLHVLMLCKSCWIMKWYGVFNSDENHLRWNKITARLSQGQWYICLPTAVQSKWTKLYGTSVSMSMYSFHRTVAQNCPYHLHRSKTVSPIETALGTFAHNCQDMNWFLQHSLVSPSRTVISYNMCWTVPLEWSTRSGIMKHVTQILFARCTAFQFVSEWPTNSLFMFCIINGQAEAASVILTCRVHCE